MCESSGGLAGPVLGHTPITVFTEFHDDGLNILGQHLIGVYRRAARVLRDPRAIDPAQLTQAAYRHLRMRGSRILDRLGPPFAW